jgi:hypothetical protein
MTVYTLVGIIAAIALVINVVRYLISKPDRLFVAYVQDFVGAFFIFSGAVKAIDPLGTAYKMMDYFVEFGMDFMEPLSVGFAVFMIVLEIALGVALILNVAKAATLFLLTGMIVFFTFLTGYTSYTGHVTDCGCFGDFLKLEPIVSFGKDIFLSVLILILLFQTRYIKGLFSGFAASASVVLITLASFFFCLYNFVWNLPVVDFRPYAIGKNIPEQMIVPEENKAIVEYEFIYKNKATGENKQFKQTEMPKGEEKQKWEFVERIDKVIKKGIDPNINNFRLEDEDGNVMNDSILMNPNYVFFVVAYNLDHTHKEAYKQLNELALNAEKDGYMFFVATSAPRTEIETFRHEMQTAYPFYVGDGTFLKTINRSNPGLMIIKNGTVVGQWHHRHLPTYSELKANTLK